MAECDMGTVFINENAVFYHLPVHGDGYSLLVKIPSAQQVCTGKVGRIKPPRSLDGEIKKVSLPGAEIITV